DITSAAGKSSAVFYRYFDGKEDLLAELAESFLHDIVTPSGMSVPLPESPENTDYFTTVVTGYWNLFKQNIGIMIAVAQLGATQPRFAKVQHEFRRFGMDMVADSVRHAAEQGYAQGLNPEHIAAAIALLFENFTVVVVGNPGSELQISDEDAITTLSTIWKKTLYGF
ncbi:MAG: TetR/AcrR family transcriptional regulator, partial [Actinobacteria bacterium]|nr:TetR/AcrR family transcriptional regulator [Actinomycetota bacterium]